MIGAVEHGPELAKELGGLLGRFMVDAKRAQQGDSGWDSLAGWSEANNIDHELVLMLIAALLNQLERVGQDMTRAECVSVANGYVLGFFTGVKAARLERADQETAS